jgi:hypothetical protein
MAQPPVRDGIVPEESQKADHQAVRPLFGKRQRAITEREVAMQQQSSLQGMAAEEAQEVKEQEVRQLFRTAAGITPQDLIGTGFTYRHDWGDKNGQWKLNLNWGSVNANSRVFVAIGEGAPGGGKFIGGARYTLYNVAPANGVVSIWLNIEWSSPIRLSVDYLVINP